MINAEACPLHYGRLMYRLTLAHVSSELLHSMDLITIFFLCTLCLHAGSSAIVRRDVTVIGSLSSSATNGGPHGVVCPVTGACSLAPIPANPTTATTQSSPPSITTQPSTITTAGASSTATAGRCGTTSVSTIPGCWGTPGCAYYL